MAPADRVPALDAVRFFAACAVVWIHTTDTMRHSTIWCRWAVPFFTIASVWLLAQSLIRKPATRFIDYTHRRTIRLYGMFLLWNAIYLLAIALKHTAFHTGKTIHFVPDLLYGGSAEHLWFLTFLWLATIAVFPLCRLVLRQSAPLRPIAFAMVLLAVGCSLVDMRTPASWNTGSAVFVSNVWMTIPALLLGVALALTWRWLGPMAKSPMLLIVGVVLLTGSSLLLSKIGRQSWLEGVAGLGAMFIALSPTDSPAVRRLAIVGRDAFGIYIVHVLWVELMQEVCVRAQIETSAALDVSIACVAILLSWIVARVLRNTPLMIW